LRITHRQRSRRFPPFCRQVPYFAAIALLLSFAPAVPSALSATPQQALLFMLAVFVADLAVRALVVHVCTRTLPFCILHRCSRRQAH
jgi:hypothetical protein